MTRLVETSAVVLAGGSSRRMGRDKAFIDVGGREILHRVLEDSLAEVGDILIVGGDLTEHADALLRYGWVAAGKKLTFERQGRVARLRRDRRPGMGPLAGLEVGLNDARHPIAWVLACDLPFMRAAVGRRLLEELDRLLAGEAAADSESLSKEDTRRETAAAEAQGATDETADTAAAADGPDDRPAAVAVNLGESLPPLCMTCETRAAAVASRCLDAGRLKVLDFLDELTVRSLPADRFRDLGDPERVFLNVNRPEDVERAEALA